MKINSRNKLEQWLDQNYWFEDGFISEVKEINNEISLKIGYQTKGTYVAGEEQELIEFEIKPNNIKTWNYDPTKFDPSYQWCIEGINLTENGLGLKFETPYTFELIFESLEILEPNIIATYTKPWLSEKEIFVTANLKEIPKPKYWIEKLKEKGFEVCFRYYGSEEISLDKIPYPDYSGYFIQHKALVKESDNGLFFFSVKQEENQIQLSIENKDEKTIDLYKEIQKIIAEWNLIEINCGNVNFKETEWKEFIVSNKFPGIIEELKKKNVW